MKKNSVTNSKGLNPSCGVASICKKKTDKEGYHVTRDAYGAYGVSSESGHSRCSRGEQGERCSRCSRGEQ